MRRWVCVLVVGRSHTVLSTSRRTFDSGPVDTSVACRAAGSKAMNTPPHGDLAHRSPHSSDTVANVNPSALSPAMIESRLLIVTSRLLGPVSWQRMIEPGCTALRTDATMPAGLSWNRFSFIWAFHSTVVRLCSAAAKNDEPAMCPYGGRNSVGRVP